jgi:hypothetical protein
MERDNQVKRCKRTDCQRATFVETDEGISADFWHGSKHRVVFTIEEMKIYLASRGYVVVEAAKVLRVA